MFFKNLYFSVKMRKRSVLFGFLYIKHKKIKKYKFNPLISQYYYKIFSFRNFSSKKKYTLAFLKIFNKNFNKVKQEIKIYRQHLLKKKKKIYIK